MERRSKNTRKSTVLCDVLCGMRDGTRMERHSFSQKCKTGDSSVK
jgi:hypothetical protein